MTRSEDASSPSDDVAGLDALDGEHGPARPLSALERDAVADRVLGRLAARSSGARAPGRVSREASGGRLLAFGRGVGSRRRARWLVAAGVTLATAAAALYGTTKLGSTAPESGTASGSGRGASERSGAPTQATSDAETTPAAPVAPVPLAPAPSLEEAPPAPGGRPISGPPTPPAVPDRNGGRGAPTRAHESPQAADQLARANALRGKHQYRDALERYLYVVSEYPGSMQSRAAQLAAAAIRLEHLNDSDGAEHLYQAVVNDSDGELAAQASFGLAEVARARADRGAEAQALRDFLARHGSHPLAAAARRRLNDVEAP